MLTIVHGKIKTMAQAYYQDGFLQIENGKITAVGDMKDCHFSQGSLSCPRQR